MAKFVKRPVVIEAEQWFPGKEVAGVCDSDGCPWCCAPHVHTAHGGQVVRLEPGDWIIPEPDGSGHYPCKDEIFRATYDPVKT